MTFDASGVSLGAAATFEAFAKQHWECNEALSVNAESRFVEEKERQDKYGKHN